MAFTVKKQANLNLKKNTTFKIPRTEIIQAFLPSSLGGLALWLKADAGITTLAEQFISTIVISASTPPRLNGSYTRAAGGTTSFIGPNGNRIDFAEVDELLPELVFSIYDALNDESAYVLNIAGDTITSTSYFGGLGIFSTLLSPTGNTLIVGWADQSGNNNNFNGSSYFQQNSNQAGGPAIYFNGFDSHLDSPSTLLDNFSEISLFGVWYILGSQSNKGIFGTSNYSNLEITANFEVAVRIRNNNYSDTFISEKFSNLDEWTISYLDAQNLNGVAYKNGQLITRNVILQLSLTGAGTTTSDGTYTRASGGTTQFDGPNGNYIWYDGAWIVYDDNYGGNTYYTDSLENPYWTEFDGGAYPYPTQTTLSSVAEAVTKSSAVEMPLGSGNTYSLGRYAGRYAEIYLAEFIIYNKRLTTPERQQVEAYLNSKYQIY